VQRGYPVEDRRLHGVEVGCTPTIGEHRSFAILLDEDDDTARSPVSSCYDVDTSCAQDVDQQFTEAIIADLSDESCGASSRGGEVCDVGGATAASAFDARWSIAGVMGGLAEPYHDIFDQITECAEHLHAALRSEVLMKHGRYEF